MIVMHDDGIHLSYHSAWDGIWMITGYDFDRYCGPFDYDDADLIFSSRRLS